jgi:SWI/SNF-related matrix-associated actin-dependent regulator 1 of chromatin subfamily A
MYLKLKKYTKQLSHFGINYDDIKLEFHGKHETQDSNKTVTRTKQKIVIRESWKAFIMPIGKHKGKSMAQLAEENLGYLQWIAENEDFNNKDVKAAAVAVVNNKEIGATPSQSSDLTLSIAGDRIHIRFPYNEELISKAQELSVRKFEKDETGKYWTVPLNNVEEVLEKFPNAKMSSEFIQFVANRKLLQSKARAMSTDAEFDLGGFGHGKTLMPFQKACLEFLQLAKGRALIADEMGLGKTIEILSFIQLHKDARTAVIVCPASLKLNWRYECETWLDTNDDIQVIKSGKQKALIASIIIINYDMLKKYKEEIKQLNPQIMVFDESHMLKNLEAQRTKAAQEITENVPMVILATGTPVLNKPKELYTQLNIINPRLYPTKGFFNFGKKFCGGKEISIGFNRTAWDFSGATNLKELATLLQAVMIRRIKEDVLKELPDKRRVPVVFELDNRAAYRAVELELEEIKDMIKDLYIEYQETQSVSIQKEIEMLRGQLLGGFERLSQIVIEGKMKNAIEWIDNSFIATGTKVVIFATHIKTLDKLQKHFEDDKVKFVRIDGSVKKDEVRQAAKEKFQNDPEILVFLGNIKAAGVGLTLTASSNVVFLELGWTPADHDQAEDRTHRITQKNAVTCYYTLSEDTIEEYKMMLLEEKRGTSQTVVSDNKKLRFDLYANISKYACKQKTSRKVEVDYDSLNEELYALAEV